MKLFGAPKVAAGSRLWITETPATVRVLPAGAALLAADVLAAGEAAADAEAADGAPDAAEAAALGLELGTDAALEAGAAVAGAAELDGDAGAAEPPHAASSAAAAPAPMAMNARRGMGFPVELCNLCSSSAGRFSTAKVPASIGQASTGRAAVRAPAGNKWATIVAAR